MVSAPILISFTNDIRVLRVRSLMQPHLGLVDTPMARGTDADPMAQIILGPCDDTCMRDVDARGRG